MVVLFFFFFQAEDGIRDADVTGVQTCALPICMKSPANFGELDGMTKFESWSVSARVTVLPAFVPFTAVAVALMAKNGVTAAVLAAAFSVTTYTAAASFGAVPEVPGADALIRIFPLYTETPSVPPLCGSGDCA